MEYDTHGPPEVRNERGPLAKRPVPISRVPGGDGWRNHTQEGLLKTHLPEAAWVRPGPSPTGLRAGQQSLPRPGRPCSGWSPHSAPRQPPRHTPALLPKCCGNSVLWETFLEDIRTQTFFNQNFRNPDHFQRRPTLKPDTSNPLFEFVPPSFETTIFWKAPGSKIPWEGTN